MEKRMSMAALPITHQRKKMKQQAQQLVTN
jgi:hypothetical protein